MRRTATAADRFLRRVALTSAVGLAALPLAAQGRRPPAPGAAMKAPAAAPSAEPSAPKAVVPEGRAVSPSGVPAAGPVPAPVVLAELPNINDFTLFANGAGWDGNWYVGYNTCWVSKLPPAPPGGYVRAYVGARLGRMKTEPVPGRPSWEKRPVGGEVVVAVAPEPLWPQSRRFLLCNTREIPLEGDAENAVEGVGESRWFWTEVPLKYVATDKDNYVALFSPSEALKDAAHAPVLAAGWGDTRQNTWLNSTVKGEPPFTAEEALKTGVTYFEPAIAIKLVPANAATVRVTLRESPAPGAPAEEKIRLAASVEGTDVERAWVEFSTDTKTWRSAGRPLSAAPYTFTVKRADLPVGRNALRVVAADALENRGVSAAVTLDVPPPAPPKKAR